MIDVHHLFNSDKKILKQENLPPGTFFYSREMKWNVLDHFLISKNLSKHRGIYLDVNSYEIIAAPFMKKDYVYGENDCDKNKYLSGATMKGAPMRYDSESSSNKEAGFSDHFPITVKLRY